MFNRSTLDVGANLSEVLVNSNVKLVPRGGTLLGELNNSITNVPSVVSIGGNLHLESVKDDVGYASVGTEVGNGNFKSYAASEHDTFMDNYIDDLSTLVSGYLNFSRNVVNKEVTKLVDDVVAAVNNYRHREAEDFFEIEYYKLPDVFSGYSLTQEIGEYKGNSEKGSTEDINLKVLESEEDLSKYFLLGDAEEDLLISGWMNGLGGKVKGYLFDKVEDYTLQLTDQLDYYLVNFLFHRNLTNTADLNTGDSSATLRRKAGYNRDYYGIKLLGAIQTYKRQMQQGKLIASNNRLTFSYFNEGTVKLCIYEEGFAKLAEAGGGIEVLLGYIVSGDSTVAITVDELVADMAKHKNLWDKTRSLYLVHLNNKRLDIFKHTLRKCFEESISKDNLTEAEEEVGKDSNFQTTTVKLANDYIDQISINEIECMEKLALELVARIRFRFTNAYELLARMSELLEADDKLEPMEAALYSAVDYLTDYMLSQADVLKG